LAAAEQQFRMAIDTGSLAARNNLGMLLTQRGDYTAAWQQFQAGSLDAAAARNNFAVALMSAGKWLEGREQLLLALKERRGYGPALRNFRIVQRHISGE
jgi:lipoprotein NlpI